VKIPDNIVTLIAGIALTLASLWYGQNHGLMPVAASAEATQVDDIFSFMMTIATGLFLLIEGVLIYVLIKFRRKKGDQTDGPPIEGNVPLEIVWTAIPTVIVFVLSLYSFEIYNNMGGLDPMASHDHGTKMAAHHGEMVAFDSSKRVALGLGKPLASGDDAPLVVNVNGIQYAWIFTYPESGIMSGELHVPVNKTVQLNITASDVLHAFWLPEFRIKQDAIPGRDSELAFTPIRTGAYPIICAELCGAYHGGMKTMLYVESEDEYNEWVEKNTLAQADAPEQVALQTKEMSEEQYLAPYIQEMGINRETLASLHSLH
jgi:cytochrome c oxidase subunit 2